MKDYWTSFLKCLVFLSKFLHSWFGSILHHLHNKAMIHSLGWRNHTRFEILRLYNVGMVLTPPLKVLIAYWRICIWNRQNSSGAIEEDEMKSTCSLYFTQSIYYILLLIYTCTLYLNTKEHWKTNYQYTC